jgi:hypothetical protein
MQGSRTNEEEEAVSGDIRIRFSDCQGRQSRDSKALHSML